MTHVDTTADAAHSAVAPAREAPAVSPALHAPEERMHIAVILASLYVRDLAAAAAWYTTLFGRAPDAAPHPMCREWEVVPNARVQVLQAPDDRAPASVAFVVADVGRERARILAARRRWAP
jgi:hypothetical protein